MDSMDTPLRGEGKDCGQPNLPTLFSLMGASAANARRRRSRLRTSKTMALVQNSIRVHAPQRPDMGRMVQ